MTERPRRRLRRFAIAGAGAVSFAVLAIGALHLPFARGLLMRVGGCPLAAGSKMTPVEMDNARHMAVAASPGTQPAPARPALRFALDTTTVADVHAWAKSADVDCDDEREGYVRCTDVPASALDKGARAVDELVLAFDTRGHLVNVTTLREHLTPQEAAACAGGISTSLRAELGPSDKAAGTFDAAHLSQRGAYSTAIVSYRFTDYAADVTAMTFGESGTSVREHYMSAND